MISCPSVSKRVMRTHYNLCTLFYRLLWGPHIHHGLWEGDENESARSAQLHLTERLADLAEIGPGQSMIDIGCGMGGSSIHLAKTRQVQATGVTISPVQRLWANTTALTQGVRSRATFLSQDVEQIDFPSESVDVVWSVECTEHLFDKPAFFQKAARWLKPGGRIAICAWLAGSDLADETKREQVWQVCEGFFCPSLATSAEYVGWMESAGLTMTSVLDWTQQVARTWEICRDRVHKSGIRKLARVIDRDTVMFLDRFEVLLNAYRSGAMEYGCFVARKP